MIPKPLMTEEAIPEEYLKVAECREMLMESVAQTDEVLFENICRRTIDG